MREIAASVDYHFRLQALLRDSIWDLPYRSERCKYINGPNWRPDTRTLGFEYERIDNIARRMTSSKRNNVAACDKQSTIIRSCRPPA